MLPCNKSKVATSLKFRHHPQCQLAGKRFDQNCAFCFIIFLFCYLILLFVCTVHYIISRDVGATVFESLSLPPIHDVIFALNFLSFAKNIFPDMSKLNGLCHHHFENIIWN